MINFDCFYRVVGHTFICYGPLLAGAATILYEGKPVGTPDASICWRLIEKYKIKGMYTAPTAIRAIRKDDPEGKWIPQFDISSLKCMHIVGERLDVNTAAWVHFIITIKIMHIYSIFIIIFE